jgi:hypothetical protein
MNASYKGPILDEYFISEGQKRIAPANRRAFQVARVSTIRATIVMLNGRLGLLVAIISEVHCLHDEWDYSMSDSILHLPIRKEIYPAVSVTRSELQ